MRSNDSWYGTNFLLHLISELHVIDGKTELFYECVLGYLLGAGFIVRCPSALMIMQGTLRTMDMFF
jgi:hypothetical protein